MLRMAMASVPPSLTTTGRLTMASACRMAACGWLMMGVEATLPRDPGLLTVKVPPETSSGPSSSAPRAPDRVVYPAGEARDVQLVGAGDDRHDQGVLEVNGDADVDLSPQDDPLPVPHGVQDRVLLEPLYRRRDDEGQIGELHALPPLEGHLLRLPQRHETCDVDLDEGPGVRYLPLAQRHPVRYGPADAGGLEHLVPVADGHAFGSRLWRVLLFPTRDGFPLLDIALDVLLRDPSARARARDGRDLHPVLGGEPADDRAKTVEAEAPRRSPRRARCRAHPHRSRTGRLPCCPRRRFRPGRRWRRAGPPSRRRGTPRSANRRASPGVEASLPRWRPARSRPQRRPSCLRRPGASAAVPASGEGSSVFTLSVSTSARGSSSSTSSPSAFSQRVIVPSVTLSPSWGIVTGSAISPPSFAASSSGPDPAWPPLSARRPARRRR